MILSPFMLKHTYTHPLSLCVCVNSCKCACLCFIITLILLTIKTKAVILKKGLNKIESSYSSKIKGEDEERI